MNVFILEDCFMHQQMLKKLIQDFLKKQGLDHANVFETAKPHALLSKIKEHGNHQIYFLCLKIGGSHKKGFETAIKIREKDPYGSIVFLTESTEFIKESFKYKVAALEFLNKSLDPKMFQESIHQCLEITQRNMKIPISNDVLHFSDKKTYYQFNFCDIFYFETIGNHQVRAVCRNNEYNFYGSLQKIRRMDARLFQSSRSFVVNPMNIVKVDKKQGVIYFENKGVAYISKKKISNLEKHLQNYENGLLL